KALLACTDETGRKRCELFRDLPDKRLSTIHSATTARDLVSKLMPHVLRTTQITIA
ncbi:hypothetical protein DENSPDRAFT_846489, partial [Dentipellis sp. KUC8613]